MKPTLPRVKRHKVQNTDVNAYWTLLEKEKLLRAIRLYGFSKSDDSLSRVSQEVVTKDTQQVAHFMNRRLVERKDFNREERGVAPIDIMLEKAKRSLAQQFDFSSAFEKAFAAASGSTEEFQEIYKFMHLLIINEYPSDLKPQSAGIMVKLMSDLAGLIHQVGADEIIEAVEKDFRRTVVPNESVENAESLNVEESASNVDKLYTEGFVGDKSDCATLNPLNISPKLLTDIYQRVKSTYEINF